MDNTKTSDIKDYLPLYLGQKATIDGKHFYQTIQLNIDYNLVVLKMSDNFGQTFSKPVNEIKLLLRPLSSMTEEEARGGYFLWTQYDSIMRGEDQVFSPVNFIYLLSKGFDILNLHSKGLCLYPEEIKE